MCGRKICILLWSRAFLEFVRKFRCITGSQRDLGVRHKAFGVDSPLHCRKLYSLAINFRYVYISSGYMKPSVSNSNNACYPCSSFTLNIYMRRVIDLQIPQCNSFPILDLPIRGHKDHSPPNPASQLAFPLKIHPCRSNDSLYLF